MLKNQFKILSIIILVLFINVNKVFAQQQQTAYEKKVAKITEKYFSICYYGYNKSLTMSEKAELQMLAGGEEARNFILGLGLMNYAMNHTEAETKKLIKQFDKELKTAERLKTSIDYKREKEQKKLQAQKEFEKTDNGNILKNIKTEFKTWNQKGEFEKQSDYDKILKTESKNKFSEICMKNIKERINTYFESYDSPLSMELLTYDSENEFFPILFKLNKKEWKSEIKIPIDKAVIFKEIWSRLEWKNDEYNWCLIDNNLFPTIITLQEKKKYYGNENIDNTEYKFKLTLDNLTKISYSFDDFKIDNLYLKGVVFKYSEAKELARKKFIKDSLNYDSLIIEYNQALLKNTYNVKMIQLPDTKHLVKGDDFTKKSQLLKENFDRMNKDIELYLKRNQAEKYCEIYYSQHPVKKIEADKKYIECKCNYSRELFDVKFIDNSLSSYNCDCREKEYLKVKNLFKTKNEFNTFFDKGDLIFTNEIEKRTVLAYINANFNTIKSIDLKKAKKESFGSALVKDLADVSHSNYENENRIREKLNNLIIKSQNKNYYPQIVELLIETNQKLNKEWSKNGKYFSDKVNFFDIYLLNDYKKKLKERKKK